MPRDITPLTRALEQTTVGSETDVYTLLAGWNTAIENALESGGGGRFRTVMNQYHEDVIKVVDGTATTGGIDWEMLEECTDAYPPGVGDHYCSSVIVNVVARCVIRTRIHEDVSAIPAWALEYLGNVTMEEDGDSAWESSGALGWGVDHPSVPVCNQAVARAGDGDDLWATSVLEHAAFADPETAVDLLERLLADPDIVEDLLFVEYVEPALNRAFPARPKYWEHDDEFDYHTDIDDETRERLLKIVGETIHPDRLRQFAETFSLDLQRAADEYGTTENE